MVSEQAPRELETVARRFHERHFGDGADLAGLIHEDAEMSPAATHLLPLQGRDEILGALKAGSTTIVSSAQVYGCEWLDPATLLVSGQAGFAYRDGFSSSSSWWLDAFEDGLLRRVREFRTEQEARDAYRRRFGRLVVPAGQAAVARDRRAVPIS